MALEECCCNAYMDATGMPRDRRGNVAHEMGCDGCAYADPTCDSETCPAGAHDTPEGEWPADLCRNCHRPYDDENGCEMMDALTLTVEQSNLAYSLARIELQAATRERDTIALESCDSSHGIAPEPCDRCARAFIAGLRVQDAASLVSALESVQS